MMSERTGQIDTIMQQASEALVQMQYLRCERLCVQAMELARQANDYERVARILLPLQEARRQRRQAALEVGVFVLSRREADDVTALLDRYEAGCLLLIDPPFTADDERKLRDAARQNERMIEVLRLDQARLRSTFEHEMEARGDAALAQISTTLPAIEQVDALAEVLEQVGDHEIAHQRLAAAARQASHQKTG